MLFKSLVQRSVLLKQQKQAASACFCLLAFLGKTLETRVTLPPPDLPQCPFYALGVFLTSVTTVRGSGSRVSAVQLLSPLASNTHLLPAAAVLTVALFPCFGSRSTTFMAGGSESSTALWVLSPRISCTLPTFSEHQQVPRCTLIINIIDHYCGLIHRKRSPWYSS